jgi:hypothetical protein
MTELPHEALGSVPNTLADLQAGREYAAQQDAETRLLASFNPSIVTNRSFAVGKVERNWSGPYDQGRLDAGTLMSLDALGFDPHQVVTDSAAGYTGDEVAAKDIGAETLHVYAYRQGLSFRLKGPEDEASKLPSAAINNMLRNRLSESPAHKAFLKASESLRDQPVAPSEVYTEPFNIADDPLASMVFFDDIGLTESSNQDALFSSLANSDTSNEQILDKVVAAAATPKLGRMVQHTENGTTITWQDRSQPVRKKVELRPDGSCTYGVEQVPMGVYLEQASLSPESLSLPFIETQAAQEIAQTLDSVGLMFHPRVQYEMMRPGQADRYGSIYTQLSRQVAKWVNDPVSLTLSDLFVPYDARYSGLELMKQNEQDAQYAYQLEYEAAEAREEAVRQAFTTIERLPQAGEAGTALLDMIEDVLAVEQNPTLKATSDVPVTSERVQIRNGACFDVAAYYASAAADMPYGKVGLTKVRTENDVRFLEKMVGSHTFLSRDTMRFNGVHLPKGSLFQHATDGGWAFLRLTPFAFDEAVDQLAFGSEMTKMFTNEQAALRRIGNISLGRLVDFAK